MAEPAPYLIDRDGVVWMVTRDGGMVIRVDEASKTNVESAGIQWLKEQRGPLVPFDPRSYVNWIVAHDLVALGTREAIRSELIEQHLTGDCIPADQR